RKGREQLRGMVRRAGPEGGSVAGRGLTMIAIALGVFMSTAAATPALNQSMAQRIDDAAARVESKVIACRRDIHEHPELGNREVRTAKLVADRLKQLGIEVRTPIAHT